MNLLLLDQFSDPGGAQMNLLELLPAIRAAGWRALAGLPGSGELFERVRALGFETERIPCGPYRSGGKSAGDWGRFVTGTPRLGMCIRRMARRAAADLIYVNGPRLLPAAALAAAGRPVLFHSHSAVSESAARQLAGWALRHMDAWVVGQCEFVAAPWRAWVARERVLVIYNGVSGPARAPAPRIGESPRVGCIGRIAPEKGQREFVAAAERIHRAIPECRFIIYGAALFGDRAAEAYAEQVRADAAGLPVEFAGWAGDIPARLSQLDLLLVPSGPQEATTRVILEAFAEGVPVVAFPSGGIPEVVEHGVNGMLSDGVEAMARCAMELLTDTARRTAMAQAARESWQRRFTLERYQREVMAAIAAASVRN